MDTSTLDYGLLVQKIDKKNHETTIIQSHSPDKTYYTASTIKTIFCGLFLEYCEDLLYQTISIPLENRLAGGFLSEVNEQNKVSYEILLYLMIIISDNTATITIYEALCERFGDITNFLAEKFWTKETRIFDARTHYDYATSTASEFWKLLHYFLIQSSKKDFIKKILSYQYVKGRGLRYIDSEKFILAGNKTGQLDDMINDSGFLETKDEIYLYNIFMKVPKDIPFQYGVENEYYQAIGKIIREAIDQE